ncbi:Hypothetical protein LEPBI_II0219 [Leptospira biflexa serovar Patoc strain 'Patoc 1 (Paris)']|uniref:Uncharacterized protein n=1 Tax=Leptospira biflexa serovar Patoc (strain Patoc 1 / ATCC 23582 / Paris) TaxID=456481 RepID=B0SU68_LEPBP|nr:Hypothetical protein LEPBI_II0219 [Leptospira biflexa serovar Patoc strain 'Patoc 1 (Paris)']
MQFTPRNESSKFLSFQTNNDSPIEHFVQMVHKYVKLKTFGCTDIRNVSHRFLSTLLFLHYKVQNVQ